MALRDQNIPDFSVTIAIAGPWSLCLRDRMAPNIQELARRTPSGKEVDEKPRWHKVATRTPNCQERSSSHEVAI